MTRYNKGANAERELIKVLWANGFATVRAAGSGVTPLPSPDLITLGNGRKVAFECKAWDSSYLNIPIEQFLTTKQWCSIAGADFFVAWKIPNRGWLFLKPSDFSRADKNFCISLKKAHSHSVPLNVILGRQSLLEVEK